MEPEALPSTVLAARYETMRSSVAEVVVGQTRAIQLAFVALLCGGHVLFQGVPGVAKTLLVRTLAAALAVRFGRVQFTPDLMPSDIMGSPVYHAGSGDFRFRPGPIFTDLLLGDEVNRAPAKTQAAMLEAMQERAVTMDGQRHELGPFFTVFATQNPIEQEGTYPLPEAELDRFLFRIDMDYPSAPDELRMLTLHHVADPQPQAVPAAFTIDLLRAARQTVCAIGVREEVFGYALALLRATRDDANLSVGGSPRAGLWLVRAAKAIAALAGRDYVTPEDVQDVWRPVLRHRVVLAPAAEVEGMTSDEALAQVLKRVPIPH
jgi:MoxR-like ATPase